MRASLREALDSPIYRRELPARGCRGRAIAITLGVAVGLYYLAMILLLVAAAGRDTNAMMGVAMSTLLGVCIADVAVRVLGVLLTADAISAERSTRTLDPLLLCPAPRPAIVLAKLLARLRPFRPLLYALVPGLVVFPPCLAWLMAPMAAAAAHAPGTTHGTLTGLTATFYLTTLWPVLSIVGSLFLGSSIGLFFSAAMKDHGLALALAFVTVLLLSLGFCFVSYFALMAGAFGGGFLTATVDTAFGTLPALLVMSEELLLRVGPAALLLYWLTSDFERLAGD